MDMIDFIRQNQPQLFEKYVARDEEVVESAENESYKPIDFSLDDFE